MERFATPRWSRGIGTVVAAGLVMAVVASACGPSQKDPADPSQRVVSIKVSAKPSATATATPTATPKPITGTPVPQATPDPMPKVTVSVGTCCTVGIPQDWVVSGPDGSGAYVAQGSNPALLFTFTTVGTSVSCPAEPVSAEDESRSIVHHDPLTISGDSVTAYVTADADTSYQYIDADVTVAGLCVDVAGEELGVASSANRLFLEGIMQSVAPVPSTPTPSPSPSATASPIPTANG